MLKSFTTWIDGTHNKEQVLANSRDEAIDIFVKDLGVGARFKVKCRYTRNGDYLRCAYDGSYICYGEAA